MKKYIVLSTLSLFFIFVLTGCSIFQITNIGNQPVAVNSLINGLEPSADQLPGSALATEFPEQTFSKYQLEKTAYKPAISNYNLAISDIYNLPNFEKSQNVIFSKNQKSALLKNNFFIAKNNDKFYDDNPEEYSNRVDDWTYLYGKIGGGSQADQRYPENSVFITSDLLLHVYHGLLDKEFEYIEQASFYPKLKDLSNSLLKSSLQAYLNAKDQNQKDSYERLSAYFLVSSAMLNNSSADYATFKEQNFALDNQSDTKEAVLATADSLAKENNISKPALLKVKEELTLIFDAKDVVLSPLFGKYQQEQGLDMPEDYTQYTPRSHYAKNTILRSYFRTMMWYGRTNFLLSSPELTRDAGNINFLLSADNFKNWQSIYLPTVFFVGLSDDLGFSEYQQVIKKLGVKETDDFVSKLQVELKNYKNPQIMSTVAIGDDVLDLTKEELQNKTKGFRLMGQRFTPDAFVFSTLTQGQEKPDPITGQSLPSTPTALMFSTLMGSKVSSTLLDAWIKKEAPDSNKIIANKMIKLEEYFNGLTPEQLTQNIYWSWLYTIKSVFTDNLDKNGYPMFVKNNEWDTKNLQCYLGSWTELKHDTLLYVKQSYAEIGGGLDEIIPKPVPKGYVEPNIEFLDRLIALVNLTKNGLAKFNLLDNTTFEARNEMFVTSLKFYKDIALAEIENQQISDDDFDELRLSAGSLSQILRPVGAEQPTEKRARSAIIADVHTDMVKGQILYEANGIPNYIYVAVKDINGTRLTKGLVYSYFEFSFPLGTRLTDEDWQKWTYTEQSKIPAMAKWNLDLIK